MHIPDKSVYLSRRAILRGIGATVALPFLECMTPPMRAAALGPTRRMVFVYLPNGIDMANWTPGAVGTNFELPSILQPLAPFKSHFSVLSGLAHVQARSLGDGAGDHARANACFLTGVHPRKTAGADISVGVSADQLASQQIGKATRLPSIELSCDNSGRQAGACDSGYACAYQNNISWRNETTPMPPIVDPRLVFERMFTTEDPELAAGRALRESCRGSILDIVREDAKTFRSHLGATDRRKLDEYLTALRETEVQIEQMEKFGKTLPKPTMPRPEGIPGDFAEHLRLMYDLLALALQTDSTRIASFLVSREGSNRPYPSIGVTEGHHDLSHHGNSEEKTAKIAKINRFHIEQFAYFLGKLKSMREASGGSVLDNSMIVLGSAIADGNKHQHHDLPVLLCGGGGGALKPGRHVQYGNETPMTNLYLSLLDHMGVKAGKLGDSTGKLENL